jgi:hypothetical protein
VLSDNQPIKQDSEAGILGSAGSAQGGAYSRIGLMPGLTLLGGASYGNAEYENADIDNSFIGAAALRYVKPTSEQWHPFAQGEQHRSEADPGVRVFGGTAAISPA